MQPVKRYVYTSLGMYPRDDDPPSAEHWVRWEDHEAAVAAARVEAIRDFTTELDRRLAGAEADEQMARAEAVLACTDPDEMDGCE